MYGAQGKLLKEIAMVEVFCICDKLEIWKEYNPMRGRPRSWRLGTMIVVEESFIDQQFPKPIVFSYIIEARVALTILV